jgi:carbon-monoxide dehydrogenase large subunit
LATASLCGSSIKRKEDPRMIAGKGTYLDDVRLPGMVHAVFVRSPYAHAKIKSIDASKAKKVQGVVAVYTGAELEQKLGPVPCAWQVPTDPPIKIPRYTPLAVDKVRYVGDPVAVVVAQDLYVAQDAAELVKVEYQLLPSVVSQEEAVRPGAPQLYDNIPNNTCFVWHVSGGEADRVFKDAEVIVKQRFVNQRLQPTAIEPRGAVAQYNSASGETTVWITSQNPHVHRLLLSGMTGIAEQKMRVIAPDVGGGFGSKIPCYGSEAVVVALARELGRPVKWVETRRENYVATSHGRDHVEYVELAAKKDGTILGIRVKTYANMGAYLSTAGPGVPTILFGLMLSGCYKMRAVDCVVYGVLTNTTPVDAYRGAGRPEASYVVERMVDTLAHEIGMDPAEVRLKNFIATEDFPYTVATGLQYDSGNYQASLKRAMELVDYWGLREQQKKGSRRKLLGIGISSYVEMCGLGPSKVVRSTGFGLGLWDSAVVRVHPTGKVTVYTGANPHGQGEETSFAQIAADELGVPFEDVEVVHGDTSVTPFGMGTYGSRTLSVAGSAIAVASRKVVEKAKKIAAALLEAKEEDVVFESGKLYVRGVPAKYKTIQQVALESYTAENLPAGVEPGLEATTFYDPQNFVFPFGSHICVVEVDTESGTIQIVKYVAVDDCGRQINPMLVEGQVHGGITQGVAQALWEEAVYDSQGNLLTSSLAEYAVPTTKEVPSYLTDFTVTPTNVNPLGIKGIGETGTIASSEAVVNAVVDALWPLGVKNIDMPLKSEKIWRALKTLNVSSA